VGGITTNNAKDYLKAGAIAVGIGSDLTRVDWSAPDFETISRRTAFLLQTLDL
jgi:2-keto-3-deoxy-6-phosphogluconate aldolase